MKKIGLFFGGIGNEAEVSVISAQNVAANIDRKKFELVLIYWDRDGQFYQLKDFSEIKKPKRKILEKDFAKLFDVALPMTHGKYGEDGILQGIFERHKIRYCGCRVLSSSLCMDKAVCKNFLEGHGISQVPFEVIDYAISSKQEIIAKIEMVKKKFSLPLFVKPANSGSSVGITKIDDLKDLEKAIRIARKHDNKIVIEEGVTDLREVEVGILGNTELIVSKPGELVLPKEFYDYDEKYKNNRTEIKIPASLNKKEEKQIMEMAEKIYRLCDCRGFSRLDFFVANGKVYFNEINTLPGFTQFSMYPMLMMDTKMNYSQLLTKIISLAY